MVRVLVLQVSCPGFKPGVPQDVFLDWPSLLICDVSLEPRGAEVRVGASGGEACTCLRSWNSQCIVASTTIYPTEVETKPVFQFLTRNSTVETTEKAELDTKGCGLVSWNHEVFCWGWLLTHGEVFCFSTPHCKYLCLAKLNIQA